MTSGPLSRLPAHQKASMRSPGKVARALAWAEGTPCGIGIRERESSVSVSRPDDTGLETAGTVVERVWWAQRSASAPATTRTARAQANTVQL